MRTLLLVALLAVVYVVPAAFQSTDSTAVVDELTSPAQTQGPPTSPAQTQGPSTSTALTPSPAKNQSDGQESSNGSKPPEGSQPTGGPGQTEKPDEPTTENGALKNTSSLTEILVVGVIYIARRVL